MTKLPRVLRSGKLQLGKWLVPVHVLDNAIRALGSEEALELLAIEKVKAAKQIITSLSGHPTLRNQAYTAAALNLFKPISFVSEQGEVLEATDAESIIAVCRFLLKAREYRLLPNREAQIMAQAAESLIVSIANVGLAALIDEATGFQEDRDREALQKLLEKYLRQEYAIWAKRFPDEFYVQIFRLKNWEWKGMHINRPGIVGVYTRDIVYARLAPGVLEELERLNPSDGHGHEW